MKRAWALAGMGVMLWASSTGVAADTTWKLDKAHSSVTFSVAHLVISEVTGKFRDFDVSFVTGKEDFSDAKLSATINVASINTENERRDTHLKSGDFLDAATYPGITFVSEGFTKTGDNTYDIAGTLTIRGTSKPVVLHALYKGTVDMRGRTIIALSAATEINRFDFGVKWDAKIETGGLVAGETVKITITYEGTK
jgi:polyisoprenoid-binding protein YceI